MVQDASYGIQCEAEMLMVIVGEQRDEGRKTRDFGQKKTRSAVCAPDERGRLEQQHTTLTSRPSQPHQLQ